MLSESQRARLATQLESLPLILRGVPPEALTRRPPSGQWSAHENLAHLARYHVVFLERLRRILSEDSPDFSRYRAEQDPEWPAWSALTTEQALTRLRALRSELLALVQGLEDGQLARTGLHPAFGALAVPEWIEFFLLHEAHHLYVAMARAR